MTTFPSVSSQNIDVFSDRLHEAMEAATAEEIRAAVYAAMVYIENEVHYNHPKYQQINNATQTAMLAVIELQRRGDRN